MKIICLGDSNTWGYDPRGYWGGRYDHPWSELLNVKLNATVINQGENGREIPSCTILFPEDTALLIIMLGTNDLLQSISPELIGKKMEKFLISLNIDPRKILLIAPPAMKPGAWVQDQNLIDHSYTLAKRYKTLAQRLNMFFADASIWNLPLAYDGVHLTEDGHKIFAEELYKYICKCGIITG